MPPPAVLPDALAPLPSSGRVFRSRHRVRLGDVSPAGRLRLDAIARHLQDVATDDSRDAGLVDADAWVVRRTTLVVHRFPVYQLEVAVATWCGAIGSHWAQRRTRIADPDTGEAWVDAATLWVKIDGTTMRPARVGADFLALYGEAAGDRKVSAKLVHGDPEPDDPELVTSVWPLRFADFDALGHVNNAAGWVPVEDALAVHRDVRALDDDTILVAEVEHRRAIEPGAEVSMLTRRRAGGIELWLTDRGAVALSARVVSVRRGAGGW
jgi:acyl-ACP thioesterase